jgi:hypothetical protein
MVSTAREEYFSKLVGGQLKCSSVPVVIVQKYLVEFSEYEGTFDRCRKKENASDRVRWRDMNLKSMKDPAL